MTRAVVIMAGGAGTRLWPLSSDEFPKQFLQLFDGGSLLQKTWARAARLVPPEAIFISTNVRYRELCLGQLPELHEQNIIAEPARRNTGPAIALSTFTIEQRMGDVTIAFLHSDHYIGDEPEFTRVLERAFDFAEASDHLVTIAIQPTEPNTGYGYLELADELAPGVLALTRIVEKPDRARAEAFLAAGNFAWNAGMFVWRTSVFRRALEASAPDVALVTMETYEGSPSISIDNALMERAERVATVRGEFGWSDVGSWATIARLVQSTRVIAEDAGNVYAQSKKPVAAIGVSNIAIIESPEGILVLDLAKCDLLSAVVKRL